MGGNLPLCKNFGPQGFFVKNPLGDIGVDRGVIFFFSKVTR